MSLTRLDVVQGLIDLYETPRYLEIGVQDGVTFMPVRAAAKVAVDPSFRLDLAEARHAQPHSQFWEMSSDEYFGRTANSDSRFHVIFLDGLHTFEQTLRDLNNALLFLDGQGVVVIDDVYPSSSVAAIPDIDRFLAVRTALRVDSRDWMGDVYRLVFFIDAFWQQLTFRTVAETHGQLVLWRRARARVPHRSVEEIARLRYEDVALNRDRFSFASYAEILEEVSESLR